MIKLEKKKRLRELFFSISDRFYFNEISLWNLIINSLYIVAINRFFYFIITEKYHNITIYSCRIYKVVISILLERHITLHKKYS